MNPADPNENTKGGELRLIEVNPNFSMTRREALVFYLSMARVSLVIAGAFAAQGFRSILPFAGLELAT